MSCLARLNLKSLSIISPSKLNIVSNTEELKDSSLGEKEIEIETLLSSCFASNACKFAEYTGFPSIVLMQIRGIVFPVFNALKILALLLKGSLVKGRKP